MSVISQLTARQVEVLQELPATKPEISNTLGISPSTIEGHINNVRSALNDREAVTYDRKTEEYRITKESLRAALDDENTGSVQTQSPQDDGSNEVEIPAGIIDRLEAEGLTYSDIESEYGIKSDAARRLLQKIREEGYRIDFKEVDEEGKRLFYIPQEEAKQYKAGEGDGTYRIAVISDTHLGSKAEHLEELNDFYDRAQRRGVDFVLHAGDISDGWKVHRGQINEIKGEASGWDRLCEYVIRNYPEREGIDTLFISGNHDHKLHRRTGLYFGERIASRREDLHWLGDSQAVVVLDAENDIDIELIHPSGGQPYTVGYRLQTLYRERGLSDRPSIAIVGHIHGSMYAKTEGVHGFYAGCWKGSTTYGKRKGNQSAIGGWLMDIEIQNGEIRRLAPEWIGYESRDETKNFDLEDIQGMIS